MKILITGAAGFIGSNLSRRLLGKNNSIICVDNFDPFYDRSVKEKNIADLLKNPGFKLIEENIIDEAAMMRVIGEEKPDMIIHLAAKAGVRPSIEDPAGYSRTNINGLISVLEGAKAAGIKDIVFASSSSVYGNTKEVPFSENAFVDHPISPYAATKKAGELLCNTYSHLNGMRIASLRFFTVYGPGQRPDLAIAKFTRMIDQGKEIPFYGDGSTERDYTFIEDILGGIEGVISWLVQQPEKTHEVFNLGESHTTTLFDMVSIIEKSLGKKAKLNKMPLQPGDVRRTYADISKAREFFGYNPSTLLKEGIPRYVEWYRRQT